MNSAMQNVGGGAPIARTAGESATPRQTTAVIWVAHASQAFAADVVVRLRGHHFDAKLWDESHADQGEGLACDLVVADPAGLRMIASSVAQTAGPAHPRPMHARRGGLAPGVLRRVQALIENRLDEKIDIDELADLAGLSACHFARAFRQSVGLPPHRYIMTRRIAIGAGLLQRTERPMTEIALAVGFADHSHFTHVFTRMTGQTPSSYRRRHR